MRGGGVLWGGPQFSGGERARKTCAILEGCLEGSKEGGHRETAPVTNEPSALASRLFSSPQHSLQQTRKHLLESS